jgi:hypothetical protein
MSRRFNITGPCIPGRDFMVDLSSRLARPLAAIRRGESLVLTQKRQSGKTTLLRLLAAALQREGFAVALCATQLAEDTSLLGLYRHIEATLRQAHPLPALPKWTPTEPQSLSFCSWLGEASRLLGRRLVLVLDEYDSPPRKLVTALLRSFRAALTLADESRPFVHAIVLCGKTHVRDLRDELRPPGDESRGTGSLWNVALPLPLGPLSRREVDALLDEYTGESGVPWDRPAREALWAETRGQPYLVSRICYQIDEGLGLPRRGEEGGAATGAPAAEAAEGPSAALVRHVAAQLPDEDPLHFVGVGDLLAGRREAQEIVLRLLSGEELPLSRTDEAQSYLLDVGLLVPSEARRLVELCSPIDGAYLGRWLADQGG